MTGTGRTCNCCSPAHGFCLWTGKGKEEAMRIAAIERREKWKAGAMALGLLAALVGLLVLGAALAQPWLDGYAR